MNSRKDKGYVLLYLLVIISLSMLFATYVVAMSFENNQLKIDNKERLQAFYYAEGGITEIQAILEDYSKEIVRDAYEKVRKENLETESEDQLLKLQTTIRQAMQNQNNRMGLMKVGDTIRENGDAIARLIYQDSIGAKKLYCDTVMDSITIIRGTVVDKYILQITCHVIAKEGKMKKGLQVVYEIVKPTQWPSETTAIDTMAVEMVRKIKWNEVE